MADQDCVFCKIGRGEIPSEFLYRDESVFAIRDIRPMAPVHFLVIPFTHIGALTGDAKGQVEVVGRLFSVAAQLARQQGADATGYRLVVNQGPDSGQEVPHLHVHLLAGRPLSAIG